MTYQNYAEITWEKDKTPASQHFDDIYFSAQDGIAEAHHVFLDGNGLPQRFCPEFHIGEIGFGTGLNALVAWGEWRKAKCKGALKFTSFEAFPMQIDDMRKALSAFPELRPYRDALCEGLLENPVLFRAHDFQLEIILGDARKTLPRWGGRVDAWFLDGFAPAKNPELWEGALLSEVAHHTKEGGSFATYSAAGHIRRALARAGFQVARAPGFGGKRHMSKGVLR